MVGTRKKTYDEAVEEGLLYLPRHEFKIYKDGEKFYWANIPQEVEA